MKAYVIGICTFLERSWTSTSIFDAYLLTFDVFGKRKKIAHNEVQKSLLANCSEKLQKDVAFILLNGFISLEYIIKLRFYMSQKFHSTSKYVYDRLKTFLMCQQSGLNDP